MTVPELIQELRAAGGLFIPKGDTWELVMPAHRVLGPVTREFLLLNAGEITRLLEAEVQEQGVRACNQCGISTLFPEGAGYQPLPVTCMPCHGGYVGTRRLYLLSRRAGLPSPWMVN